MQAIKSQLGFIVLSLMILLLLTYNVSGETKKIIQAVRTDTPPIIDGSLDDVVWQKAGKVSDFIQYEPDKGKKPTSPTTVYLLYDENRLYVGFECTQNMETCQASATRRDYYFFNDDYVEVFLDTFHDKRNAYSFSVNLLSTQSDRRIANEGANQRGGGPGGDKSWDCDWDGRAAKGEGKWSVEISIPFSELRFKKEKDAVWGINFWRSYECLDEEDTWADLGNQELAVSRFGELVGLPVEQLVTTRPLELKPYLVAKPQKSSEWQIIEEGTGDLGLDVRYPFSSITLDMTLNPDYAQIEADPERINLSDEPWRLSEKRPFFQEGAELFRTPIEIFYTRAIENPLLGIKLAGKVGNYNIAMLDSLAENLDSEEDDEEEELQEGNNNFFVFRTQRDIGEKSTVGILGVDKRNKDNYNQAIGVDANTSLPKDIKVGAQYALTRADKMKENSDADAFSIEGGREVSGLSFGARYMDIGRDFEAEAGFVPDSRIDRRGGGFGMGYHKQFKDSVLSRLGSEMRFMTLYNHDGELTNQQIEISPMIGIWDFFFRPGFEWYRHKGIDEEADKEFTDKTIGFFGGFFPPKWIRIFTRGQIGKIEDEDTIFLGPEITVNPMEDLTLRTDIQWLERGDEKVFNRRFTIEYRFTQRMHFRASMENATKRENDKITEEKDYIFLLYSWEFKPESNFYWVYTMNRGRDMEDTERIVMEDTEHIVFVKLSYLMKWNIF